MNCSSNNWMKDDFEEWISRALIASHESKLLKIRDKAMRRTMIKKPCMAMVRSHGLFIPANDRVALLDDRGGNHHFDTNNDPLPKVAVLAQYDHVDQRSSIDGVYMMAFVVRKVNALKKGWKRISDGAIYSVMDIEFGSKGYAGTEHFVTISRDGMISTCEYYSERQVVKGGREGGRFDTICTGLKPSTYEQMSFKASIVLQLYADKRFTWGIDAFDGGARVNLGCTREEVKSLLYARQAPLTDSGRKRPIMHLVNAHKRRIKNGTDVDITSFLRGTREIEISGTRFVVNAPISIVPDITENSVRNYYGPI